MGSCAVGLVLVMFRDLRHCMLRVSVLNLLDKSVLLFWSFHFMRGKIGMLRFLVAL